LLVSIDGNETKGQTKVKKIKIKEDNDDDFGLV
jgi:hypothetical protein